MYFQFHFCEKLKKFQITSCQKPILFLGYEKCKNIHWKSEELDDLTIIHGFIEAENEFEAVTDIHFFFKH